MSAPERVNLRDLDGPSLQAAVAPYGVDEVVARRIFAVFIGTGPPGWTAWRGWPARRAWGWSAIWSFRTCRSSSGAGPTTAS